jgi:hypothetical protein
MAVAVNWIPNGLGYDGNWSTSSLAATPVVQAQADPYGGTAAGKIVPDSTSNYHALWQGPSAMGPFPINTDITLRHIFKAAGMNTVGFLADFGGGNNASVSYDLSTGLNLGAGGAGVITVTSSNITSLGNGWYECELVIQTPSTTYQYFNFHTFVVGLGNSSNGVYAYWPRVYSGAIAAERVTYVGSAKGTTTCTPPTHQAGDLFVLGVFRDGSTTAPTIGTGSPTAWTAVNAPTGANTCWARVLKKTAASNAETVGTFTNATEVVLNVYRPAAGYAIDVGASANGSASGTTVTYPVLTLQDTSGYSWVFGFAGHRSTNTTLKYCAGTSFVQTNDQLDATAEAVTQDTREGVTSFSAQAQGVGGTSSGWFAFSVEIKAVAAVTNYTMTAGMGSFSLSGQIVGMLAARKAVAGLGAFSLSGQAVGLRRGYPLAVGRGTFTLSGQAVQLPATRRAVAANATFTLNGQAVGLRRGRTITADYGAFVFSGQQVILRAARKTNAVHASFTLAGQAVSLRKSGAGGADYGSFSLNGQPVTLRVDRKVAAGRATLSLSGQAVALTRARSLLVGYASFNLSGQDVTLRRHSVYRLMVGTGVFVLNGQAVTLMRGSRLQSLIASPLPSVVATAHPLADATLVAKPLAASNLIARPLGD